MICCDVYIPAIDWKIYAYFSVSRYYVEEITERLESIGCSGEMLSEASRSMYADRLDTGLTYSNKDNRASVIVIGRSDSPQQYFNSFLHEFRHLTDDLSDMCGIEHNGEPIAYLAGDLGMALWSPVHSLICPDCRCSRSEHAVRHRSSAC